MEKNVTQDDAYRELVSLLSAKLREVRRERGVTLADLAQDLGLGTGYLSVMENGRAPASVDGLMRTLLALGVSRTELAVAISQ